VVLRRLSTAICIKVVQALRAKKCASCQKVSGLFVGTNTRPRERRVVGLDRVCPYKHSGTFSQGAHFFVGRAWTTIMQIAVSARALLDTAPRTRGADTWQADSPRQSRMSRQPPGLAQLGAGAITAATRKPAWSSRRRRKSRAGPQVRSCGNSRAQIHSILVPIPEP
jgi:hypothetical protein